MTAHDYYNASDSEVVKLWSKKLWHEYRIKDAIFDPKHGFAGSSEDNLFMIMDEPQKGPGDRVRSTLSLQIEGRGVIGNEVLEGKEIPLDTETFDFLVDKQRFGTKTYGEMNYQRVHFDTLEEGKHKLADLWKRRRAVCAMNHLCGFTAQTDLAYTGLNAIGTPDSLHIYRPNGVANDQSLGVNDTFDVDILDELVTIAEQLPVPIRPFIYKGNPYYAMFLHGDQIADLRKSNTQWYAAMVAALSGGAVDNNPLWGRALGKWRNVIIFSDNHITQGVNSSTGAVVADTRRGVFCGACSLVMGYGRHYGHGDSRFRWFSSTWDHGDKYYASASLIWGCAAPQFSIEGTTRDYGKIIVPTKAVERVSTFDNLGQEV